jgi:hypothetical protein
MILMSSEIKMGHNFAVAPIPALDVAPPDNRRNERFQMSRSNCSRRVRKPGQFQMRAEMDALAGRIKEVCS